MTAYEIIQQHPEWIESERTPKKAIQERAKRYVDDYKGNPNFANGITKDLDDLLSRRDITNDFAGIVADGNKAQVSTDSPEYMTDKRKAQIYAIFVKAVISELSGKAICTAAQVEEWREKYAVKLEGLQTKPEKGAKPNRELKPIDNSIAEKIYFKLKDWNYINCNEDIFLWHFGERNNRIESAAPDKIDWLGEDDRVFAICCKRISKIATGKVQTSWKGLEKHFNPNPKMEWNWRKAKDRLNEAERSEYDSERQKINKFFNDILKEPKKEEKKVEVPNSDIQDLLLKMFEPK